MREKFLRGGSGNSLESHEDQEGNRLMADTKIKGVERKPTLKTIAELSGLAVPTVSRALNDAPDIGTRTKELVRKIADEIGYVPNRAGVRLRTGRTNVVSLIMSTDHNNHTGRIIAGASGGLHDSPFHLIVTPSFPVEDEMKPVRYVVETGSADAIILNQIAPEDRRVAYLMEKKFPFVTHGRSIWADDHGYYDFDNEAYGRKATKQLKLRGRQKVAFIGPPLQQSYGGHMLKGVQEGTAENGQQFLRMSDGDSDMLSPLLADYVVEFLHKNPGIDAIVTGSTNAATAAVGAIERLNRSLGEDIDIYTKEAEPYLTLMRPELLACYENVGEAGEFLAKAAIQAVRHPELPPMQKLDVPQF